MITDEQIQIKALELHLEADKNNQAELERAVLSTPVEIVIDVSPQTLYEGGFRAPQEYVMQARVELGAKVIPIVPDEVTPAEKAFFRDDSGMYAAVVNR